jgi:hypothetical protein
MGEYTLQRDEGHYVVPRHPILAGVNEFGGEGVSPIVHADSAVAGVTATVIATCRPGRQTRNNDAYGQGTSREVTRYDAALVVAKAGKGRMAGHFDRNTFFNLNGAGSSLHSHDNAVYARNLFRWLACGAPGDDDADRDGLIDAFEVWYLENTGTSDGAPWQDQDGDGVPDADEEIAGTDPADAQSYPALTGIAPTASGRDVVLTWPSVSGRRYSLYAASDLAGAWQLVTQGIAATPDMNACTTALEHAAGFFRLGVERPVEF